MRPSIKLDDYESYFLFSKGLTSEKINLSQASVVVKFCRFIKRLQLVGNEKDYNAWIHFIKARVQSKMIDQYIDDFVNHAYFDDNVTKFDFIVSTSSEIVKEYTKITYEMYTYVVPQSCKMG